MRTFNFPKLKYVGGNLDLHNNIMDIDYDDPIANNVFNFNSLKEIGMDLYIYTFPIQFPELEIIGNNLNINNLNVNSYTLPKLRKIRTLSITYNGITNISLPNLTDIDDNIEIYSNDLLSSIDFPSLININGDLNYSNVRFSLLYNFELISLNFPVLEKCNAGFYRLDNEPQHNVSKLTTITFPSLKHFNGDIILNNDKLNEETVDHILIKLASLDGTNGTTIYSNDSATRTINLSGGLNSPPSFTGLNAKTILENRGVVVMVNGV